MKLNFKTNIMKVVLEKEDVLKLIYNALCNGGLIELSCSGVELNIERNQYDSAKERLKQRVSSTICREDVWMEVFQTNGLTFIDEEGGDDEIHLTLDLALANLQEAIDTDLTNERFSYITDSLKEDGQDDAFTHSHILQMALYQDVIFG